MRKYIFNLNLELNFKFHSLIFTLLQFHIFQIVNINQLRTCLSFESRSSPRSS
jgi:hypothetical protein